MRSISRADKLWVEVCVGMSKANDLAIAETEPPTGPVCRKAEKRKQSLGEVAPYTIIFIPNILILNILIMIEHLFHFLTV
jgi:hypothetical protein